jgi:hypothetical protein
MIQNELGTILKDKAELDEVFFVREGRERGRCGDRGSREEGEGRVHGEIPQSKGEGVDREAYDTYQFFKRNGMNSETFWAPKMLKFRRKKKKLRRARPNFRKAKLPSRPNVLDPW